MKGRGTVRLTDLDGINKNELSMIEVAHEILETTGEVLDFNDLLVRVQEYLGLSKKELDDMIENLDSEGVINKLLESRYKAYIKDDGYMFILGIITLRNIKLHGQVLKNSNLYFFDIFWQHFCFRHLNGWKWLDS